MFSPVVLHNFSPPRSQHYQTLEKVLVTLEEHPAWKVVQHCGISGQSSDEGGVQDGMMYIFQTLSLTSSLHNYDSSVMQRQESPTRADDTQQQP